jgi:hypothetical protein
MPCSQLPKLEDRQDELKDLGAKYKEMGNPNNLKYSGKQLSFY